MVEFLDFILGLISGVVITILATILQNYYAGKRLQAQLEQSERNLRLRLSHEDRKRAINRLYNVIKSGKKYYKLKEELDDILKGLEAEYIPDRIKETIRKEVGKVEAYYDKHSPYGRPPEPSEEETKAWEEGEAEWYESLSPEEKFDVDFGHIVEQAKWTIEKEIRSHIKTLA